MAKKPITCPFLGQETSACVYVIEGPKGTIKIGRSKNIAQRSRDLQIGSPYEIRIFCGFRMTLGESKKIEKAVKAALNRLGHHLRGEWFMTDPLFAANMIWQAAKGQCYPDLGYGLDRFLLDKKPSGFIQSNLKFSAG